MVSGETLKALLSRDLRVSLDACSTILRSVDADTGFRVLDVLVIPEADECEASFRVGAGSIKVRCSPGDLGASLVSAPYVEHFLAKMLIEELVPNDILSDDPPSHARADFAADLDQPYSVSERAYSVLRDVDTGHDVFLIGPSSSGKSIAVRQAAKLLSEAGSVVIWVDLSGHVVGVVGMTTAIVSSKPAPDGHIVVVLDDLQGDPQRGIALAKLLSALRTRFELPIAVIAAGWPSAVSLLDDLALHRPSVISCSSSEILTHLFATEYATLAGLREEVELLARGDLFVAHAALDFIRSSGHVPTRDQIAGYVVQLRGDVVRLSAGARRMLYWLGCLGMYEVEVERVAARRMAAGLGEVDAVEELVDGRWVRKRGSYLTVGHRSLAAQIVALLRTDFPSDIWNSSPTQITVSYLRSVGDTQIRSTLDRLDLSSHGVMAPGDQHGSRFLARCWSSLRGLVAVMERLGLEDPTWGDNTASATFAAKTLSEFSTSDLAQRILGHVRSRWDYGDGTSLPHNIERPTSDRIDFDEIVKAMRDEEEILGAPREEAATLDLDQFHQTWALGLLLGLESDPVLGDPTRLARLVSAAAAAQLADGSFYPSRVPWITARVLLGLTAAGHSIHTSETVRRATAWLRRPEPEGPFDFGTWRSGTGVWNSDAMTTAMCVLALVRSGVETSEIAVSTGLRFLLASRPDWLRTGNEIDGSLAVETAIRTSMNWREYHAELTGLLAWARDQAVWARASQLASDSHTESSKVPFVATSLVEIIWTIVRSELPLILEGLAAESVAAVPSIDVGPDEESPSLTARRLVAKLLARANQRAGRGRSAVIAGVSANDAITFADFVSKSLVSDDIAQGFEIKTGASSSEIVLTVGLLNKLRGMALE